MTRGPQELCIVTFVFLFSVNYVIVALSVVCIWQIKYIHKLDAGGEPHVKGQFWGLSSRLKSTGCLCRGVRNKTNHSVLNNVTAK